MIEDATMYSAEQAGGASPFFVLLQQLPQSFAVGIYELFQSQYLPTSSAGRCQYDLAPVDANSNPRTAMSGPPILRTFPIVEQKLL